MSGEEITKCGEPNNLVTINLLCQPSTMNKPTKFQVVNPNIQTIIMVLRLNPEYIFITNYDIVTKSGSIHDLSHDLSADIENNQITVTIKHLPYNEGSALLHVQSLARIYFTLSSHRQYSDCQQSVAGWINRTYSTTAPGIDDLNGFFPEGYIKSDLPRPIKIMDLSNNPLTMKERIEGVLLKLDVTTCENKTFSVYANKDGWYYDKSEVITSKKFDAKTSKHITSTIQTQNKSNYSTAYPTLHHLLLDVSEHYSNSIYFIAEKWLNLMGYERQPFSPLNKTTLFMERKLDSKNKIINRSQLKLFQDISSENINLSALTIDDLINDVKNEESRDLYTFKIERKYAQEAAEGVEMIKRGHLYPYGDSANFVWKDLFIASMDYMAELQKEKGGIETANRLYCNEIKSYQQLANSSPSLRIVRTALIDYFTERWVAQSIIPGLLTHQSNIVYGLNIIDNSNYMHNEKFDEIIEKIAKPLGIGPSNIKSSDKPIFCSSQLNGVISTDGNNYVADFHRITPRDANYPDPVKHHGCVIRQEALHSFAVVSELDKHSEELVKLGGDKNYLYHQNPNQETPLDSEKVRELEGARQKIIENAEKPCFDINALTIDAKDPTFIPQNVADIAKFLLDVIIPKFVHEYAVVSKFVVDGQIIVNEMHSRGINVRYLGRIHDLVSKQEKLTEQNKCFLLSLESEMIARSFKVIMRYQNKNLNEFLHSLNLVLGLETDKSDFDTVYKEISEVSFEKFGIRPPEPKPCQRILILRSVLRAFGITLLGRNFDSPILASDIGDISPIVKFPFSENPQFRSYIDLATSIFGNGDIDSALELFTMALQIGENTVQPFDEGIALCYFYLSLIYEKKEDYDSAFRSCLKSLIIQEKYRDQTCPDMIVRYSLLARFARFLNKPTLAFAFADRAANLASIIMPNHPWVYIEYTAAADFALSISPEFSIKYCEARIKRCEQDGEGKKQQAVFYSLMAKAAINQKDLLKALSFEKIASSLDPANEDHKSTYLLIQKTIERSG
ncbi:hypothetical protein TRFO_39125 [Tritrichomonas foetus]|uniref:Clu domain-containing protein n=1 Tax=Tritrichomonas foetus TaxID=1144522 RepID=A0A1J4JB93_9EUKA|nr:hypothetical protein TRFO_39125 [Tritrichomonas foetus]|eukprot:OHS94701.1 hypothetical protein TRFO_39125 [Tritrichomonas foetus]